MSYRLSPTYRDDPTIRVSVDDFGIMADRVVDEMKGATGMVK